MATLGHRACCRAVPCRAGVRPQVPGPGSCKAHGRPQAPDARPAGAGRVGAERCSQGACSRPAGCLFRLTPEAPGDKPRRQAGRKPGGRGRGRPWARGPTAGSAGRLPHREEGSSSVWSSRKKGDWNIWRPGRRQEAEHHPRLGSWCRTSLSAHFRPPGGCSTATSVARGTDSRGLGQALPWGGPPGRASGGRPPAHARGPASREAPGLGGPGRLQGSRRHGLSLGRPGGGGWSSASVSAEWRVRARRSPVPGLWA